ncbi:MAG: hypothetical protein M0R51_12780 [Clostridia bacterium]|jgi:hypothetical protein|nr:hypothetical protein [Clostridia bacterium]
MGKYRRKKYDHKWTLNRSHVHFWFRVIGKWLTIKPSPLMANGIHFIDSQSGGGKTLLMNWIARNLLKKGGFMWSNIDEFKHKRIYNFELERLYNGGDTKMKLPYMIDNHYSKGIIYDEINSKFNRRQNRQRDYNDVFIPLMTDTVLHRHRHHPRIYFIGQSVLLQDTQIMSVLKYRHFVSARFRWRYYYWREQLRMVFAPYRLKVIHYKKIGITENGDPIWKKIGKSKIKISPLYLETYDTFGYAKLYDDLPDYEIPKK